MLGKGGKVFEHHDIASSEKTFYRKVKLKKKMKACQRISGSVGLTENQHIIQHWKKVRSQVQPPKNNKKKGSLGRSLGRFPQCSYFGNKNESQKLPATERLID